MSNLILKLMIVCYDKYYQNKDI